MIVGYRVFEATFDSCRLIFGLILIDKMVDVFGIYQSLLCDRDLWCLGCDGDEIDS